MFLSGAKTLCLRLCVYKNTPKFDSSPFFKSRINKISPISRTDFSLCTLWDDVRKVLHNSKKC